ncbi:hypothetical protein L226DRAFT_528860 [Lentinus tigrinus ALCF2SS1-7]|uniref:uncharacterized protein n=1 Tax=Lentinus tigrinus ALCF2SS1-7 TaxID=1328758 RepID=UPI0011660E39|nr:hypothetical protein L226DRAFT_528860 [Lentinus tigrinus ALCF2SS1-7]
MESLPYPNAPMKDFANFANSLPLSVELLMCIHSAIMQDPELLPNPEVFRHERYIKTSRPFT